MDFLDTTGKPIHQNVFSGGVDNLGSSGGMKFLETPYKPTGKETFNNVGEGIVQYAGGIPKTVADTGVLDKPAAAVAKGTRNLLDFLGVKKLFGKELNTKQETADELAGTKFSDTTKGSQVGGDPTSNIAKIVNRSLTTAELIGSIGSLGAGLAKSIAKKEAADIAAKQALGKLNIKDVTTAGNGKGKKILDIIKENDIVGNKRAALGKQGLNESQSAIGRRRNGTKSVVKPSARSIDSVGTIVSDIPDASLKPGKLYEQVSSKVADYATELSPKLQAIQAGDTSAVKNAIRTLVAETKGELGPTIEKELSKTLKTLSTTNNLDEVWQVAKSLDDAIPDKIKKGIELTSREEGIYKAWRTAREAINGFMDESASLVGDAQVKTQFKKMSSLYHALGQIKNNIGGLTKPNVGMKSKIFKAVKNVAVPSAIGYGVYKGGKSISGE